VTLRRGKCETDSTAKPRAEAQFVARARGNKFTLTDHCVINVRISATPKFAPKLIP